MHKSIVVDLPCADNSLMRCDKYGIRIQESLLNRCSLYETKYKNVLGNNLVLVFEDSNISSGPIGMEFVTALTRLNAGGMLLTLGYMLQTRAWTEALTSDPDYKSILNEGVLDEDPHISIEDGDYLKNNLISYIDMDTGKTIYFEKEKA